MAVTKDEFLQDAVNEIVNFPTISSRYQIGDPLIIQGLASMAAMLADISNQVEVTAGEPFTKARDVTVRADAAVKGILPFATPSIASIKVTNGSNSPLQILAGRALMDQQGRHWTVMGGVAVDPASIGYTSAKQVKSRNLVHTVTAYRPFYSVDLTEPDLGFMCNVLVTGFEYTTDFANTFDGERVYNIKSNERSELSLQFGLAGVSGFQPAIGDVLNITIQDTEGAVTLPVGMKFAFEYVSGPQDAQVTLELADVTQAGAAPMDIKTLREVCSYPGIYDNSAVFGSNFDFVVRKKISPVTFLSIWNEAKEELVRGSSLDNINTLFVAVRKSNTTDAALRPQITAIIARADDSYKLKWVNVVDVVVDMELLISIPSVYDSGEVLQEARALLLENYGKDSAWAKRGEAMILEKDVYQILRDGVVALSERVANLKIISLGSLATVHPEHYRYITDASLVIGAEEAR